MRKVVVVFILFFCNYYIFSETLSIAAIEGSMLHQATKPLLTEIYSRIGITLEIKDLPAKRASSTANSGEIDGELIRIYDYANISPYLIRISTPYTFFELSCFYIDDSILIEDWSDLDQFIIGKVRGIKVIDDNLSGKGLVKEVNTDIQLFKMLKSGRIDIAISSSLEGRLRANELELFNIKTKVMSSYPLYHFLHKNNSDIVDKVNQQIIIMSKSGELEFYRKKFISETLIGK